MSDSNSSPFGDYTQLPSEDTTPNWDEYTVRFDEVDIPTFQINVIDAKMAIHVDITEIAAYKSLSGTHSMEIETPVETFTGILDSIQIEEGGLILWIARSD